MSENATYYWEEMTTPIGPAVLVADAGGALRMHFWTDLGEDWRTRLKAVCGAVQLVPRADRFGHKQALEHYFAGELDALSAIDVAFSGTAFQVQVWNELRKIAPGATLSYGALADRIGRPKAVRAVGLANGRNPIGIVVPCHRVIGSDGSLTGYGGGLPRKRWLLEHEARHSRR